MKTVAEYMTKDIVKIDSGESILKAIKCMRKHEASSILVKQGDTIVGIFTERDLLLRVDLNKLDSVKIKDVMSGDLQVSNHDELYVDVLEMMQKNKIRHMPVVKDSEIVGIVSLRDLLNHYYENLEHLLGETVMALSCAVEKRDPYTAGHQQRVTQLANMIALYLKLSEKQISGVNMAAIIHDIGKVYVPAEILNKPGKLSEAELTLIKVHPQVGYDILKHIEFPWPIAEIVLQHHERLNGSGYPRGILAKDILLEAKIIAVADIVEAIASHRPYRPAHSLEIAFEEIIRDKGVRYDEAVVNACVAVFKEQKFEFK